ncbi:MAG: hypothetical protein ACN6OB_03560 [Chryseobacterium jejuense]|uniref:hypothetical protein n=1 Tax=Chryseobacterium jejuense TaxID=445960 RepID=UPI003D0E04A1
MKTKKRLSLEQFEKKTVKSEMLNKINGGGLVLQQYCHPGYTKVITNPTNPSIGIVKTIG